MERRALDDFVRRVRRLDHRDELDAAAVEAIDAFEAASVGYLLLKGPALARLLYTTVHRGYSDVDLLVRPEDLPAARAVLSDLGYTNITAAWGVEDVGGAVHADLWVRRNENLGPLMLDLHARLPGVHAPAEIAWRALEARKTSIDLNGRPVAVLDRDGLALHLATHAAQHGREDVHPLGDLEYGLEHWPPEIWRNAARLAAEVEATPAFAAGLRLLPAGARLAQQLELPATDALAWEMQHRDLRPRGTFHLKAFAEAGSPRERLGALRRALLPNREWIEWQDPRAAEGRLQLLVARAKHIARAPVWAARAWRYRRRARRAAP